MFLEAVKAYRDEAYDITIEGEIFESGNPTVTHERIARVVGFRIACDEVIEAEDLFYKFCEVSE